MERLWYDKPAMEWEEALPLGNGTIGAMVFGHPAEERIQINEESIWLGGRRNRINPDACRYIEQIRSDIFAGNIQKAQRTLNCAFAACPDGMAPYQTLGDIRLYFRELGEVSSYRRELSLDEAVCRVEFTACGTHYRREHFVSAPDRCLVMKITADRPHAISFDAKLDRGKCFDGVEKLNDYAICLYGNLGVDANAYVVGMLAMQNGGKVQTIGQTICVEGADEVCLILGVDTIWQNGGESALKKKKDWMPILKKAVWQQIYKASKIPYNGLLERHRKDYQSLYQRVEFELEDRKQPELPTDERIRSVQQGNTDEQLYPLLFQYGRYLLISCSREGGLPANLQGIWNQEFLPPWDSKYTININAQMNYWPAECTNLSECHMPLLELLKRMRENGREVARQMYGCRGFVAHHNTDIHGDCAPQDTWLGSTYWVMGAAWLCLHIWNHYEYTLDQTFLMEFYPVMCEAALFFLDYLVEKDGYLVTCPSSSPENEYRLDSGESGNVTYAAAMDSQILRDLFVQCMLAAAQIKDMGDSSTEKQLQKELSEIGIEDEDAFLDQVRRACDKLPPIQIGSDGRIMEWIEEYEECDKGHRHISHLFALHPSNQITMDQTPELAEAARKTLEVRLASGGGHTGWSRAWIINHYAKLWDGEKAHMHLKKLLELSTYPNLFDKHPPFQIDGNFGAAAGIAQMLVQSDSKRIVVLPALPKAWISGSIRGLRIRGNAEISVVWKDNMLQECRIQAFSRLERVVLYSGRQYDLCMQQGEEIILTRDNFNY